MTKTQIETLVATWLETELDEADNWRDTYGPIDQNMRQTAPLFLEDSLNEAKEALAANDFRIVEDEVAALLKASGLLQLKPGSAEYGQLCRRWLRSKVEFFKVQIDRWKGEYHDDHRRRPAAQEEKTKPLTSPLFSVVVEKYLAANPRAARTTKPLKAEFLKFIELIGGDRPIATITKADGVAYKESLQLVRKCSLLTCGKHITNADALFKWAGIHGYVPEGQSPMKGLAPSKRQAKK